MNQYKFLSIIQYYLFDNINFVGVYFTLAGQLFGNNSRVSMDSVGEGERDALIRRTDRTDCCGTVPNRFGQFYYPSGVHASTH